MIVYQMNNPKAQEVRKLSQTKHNHICHQGSIIGPQFAD